MTRARDIANFGDGIATADIGDGQVTDAKIDGMSSSKLSGALPAIDGSALTGVGLSVVDQWYMDTTFTGNASPGTNYTRLGLHIGASGMSVASGIWTFPSTGIWQIKYTQNMTETVTCRYARVFCKVSTDGGSTFPNETQETFTNLFSSAATYQFITNVFILDVTSTTDVKIRFDYNDVNDDMQWIGNSKSTYEFIRLGDT